MHAIHGNGAGELTKTVQRNHALRVLDTALEEHTDSTFVPVGTTSDVSEALRSKSSNERAEIVVMTTKSARARISMCFPWMSSRARNKLMHAIV